MAASFLPPPGPILAMFIGFLAFSAFAGSGLESVHTPRDLPQPFMPEAMADSKTETVYPWKRSIKATVFWIGEQPTRNNPVPNCKSSWDINWRVNFGGYDDPAARGREGFRPRAFTPALNPFYIALPYNDVRSYLALKPEAEKVIPWFQRVPKEGGKSICKGRWVAIRRGGTICYAQWEDCGPFRTDDWRYVFGDARPATRGNGGAGIDLSPAVRDFLDMGSSGFVDWRFVEVEEVPAGPWRRWGANNHFVHLRATEADLMTSRVNRLHSQRDAWMPLVPLLR
jgi:hypothetical protein